MSTPPRPPTPDPQQISIPSRNRPLNLREEAAAIPRPSSPVPWTRLPPRHHFRQVPSPPRSAELSRRQSKLERIEMLCRRNRRLGLPEGFGIPKELLEYAARERGEEGVGREEAVGRVGAGVETPSPQTAAGPQQTASKPPRTRLERLELCRQRNRRLVLPENMGIPTALLEGLPEIRTTPASNRGEDTSLPAARGTRTATQVRLASTVFGPQPTELEIRRKVNRSMGFPEDAGVSKGLLGQKREELPTVRTKDREDQEQRSRGRQRGAEGEGLTARTSALGMGEEDGRLDTSKRSTWERVEARGFRSSQSGLGTRMKELEENAGLSKEVLAREESPWVRALAKGSAGQAQPSRESSALVRAVSRQDTEPLRGLPEVKDLSTLETIQPREKRTPARRSQSSSLLTELLQADDAPKMVRSSKDGHPGGIRVPERPRHRRLAQSATSRDPVEEAARKHDIRADAEAYQKYREKLGPYNEPLHRVIANASENLLKYISSTSSTNASIRRSLIEDEIAFFQNDRELQTLIYLSANTDPPEAGAHAELDAMVKHQAATWKVEKAEAKEAGDTKRLMLPEDLRKKLEEYRKLRGYGMDVSYFQMFQERVREGQRKEFEEKFRGRMEKAEAEREVTVPRGWRSLVPRWA